MTRSWTQTPLRSASRYWRPAIAAYDDQPKKRLELITNVLKLLASGEVESYVSQRLRLAEARHAHELLDSGAVFGKLLLKPPGQSHSL